MIALACRTASVGMLSGGRIAFYGDILVNFSRSPEIVLAQTIRHIKQLVDTCLYNAHKPEGAAVRGRIERMVSGVINAKDFKNFDRVIRPQLHDLCERVTASAAPWSSMLPRRRGCRAPRPTGN